MLAGKAPPARLTVSAPCRGSIGHGVRRLGVVHAPVVDEPATLTCSRRVTLLLSLKTPWFEGLLLIHSLMLPPLGSALCASQRTVRAVPLAALVPHSLIAGGVTVSVAVDEGCSLQAGSGKRPESGTSQGGSLHDLPPVVLPVCASWTNTGIPPALPGDWRSLTFTAVGFTLPLSAFDLAFQRLEKAPLRGPNRIKPPTLPGIFTCLHKQPINWTVVHGFGKNDLWMKVS